MAEKWIAGAIKHPGALRAKARAAHLLKGKDDTLSSSDLNKLSAHGTTKTKRQVALARTLAGMHR